MRSRYPLCHLQDALGCQTALEMPKLSRAAYLRTEFDLVTISVLLKGKWFFFKALHEFQENIKYWNIFICRVLENSPLVAFPLFYKRGPALHHSAFLRVRAAPSSWPLMAHPAVPPSAEQGPSCPGDKTDTFLWSPALGGLQGEDQASGQMVDDKSVLATPVRGSWEGNTFHSLLWLILSWGRQKIPRLHARATMF